ncbi:YggT family protein [Aquiluna sp. KACHI24]|uniref:YggT family protein n=1 Tax=Aquiluna sp. KACHI24 TaxID=2968831 RepID=UPI00220BDF89|nr:YggT family protein [Aquiluna sp. KACHI24]BDQ00188.1 YggT family protein [Aquiluna sp. KACHI24]
MGLLGSLLAFALQIYFYVLMARFVVDLIMSVNRSWRPPGILLPVLDFVYTITDPPLKFVRRFVPPVRLGPVALDLAFTIVLIAVLFLRSLAAAL